MPKLDCNVFDIWVFRRTLSKVEYLLLHTSPYKADRYFNGGRFWQIPSGLERVVPALVRLLGEFGLTPTAIWYVTGLAMPAAELRLL